MTDSLTPEARSQNLARISSVNTRPEIALRRALLALGLRYRIAPSQIQGRPDIAFPGRRAVVFVHGCFWHRHTCSNASLPKTNTEFWQTKLEDNRSRDERTMATLRNEGWRVCVVWECSVRSGKVANAGRIARNIKHWLDSTASFIEIT